MITNLGSQRFDLFKGPFSKNDQLVTSPFGDAFLYIPDLKFSVANKVLPALNKAGVAERKRKRDIFERDLWRNEDEEIRVVFNAWVREMSEQAGMEKRWNEVGNLTLGYVTKDSCPGAGDDTMHISIPFYDIPDFIGSNAPNVTDDTPIDLVFVDFIEEQLLGILNGLQSEKKYTDSDVKPYSDIVSNQILGLYAQQKWS